MTAPSLVLSGNLQNIPWKDLKVGKLVGEGGFAEVYRGNWNGREVAIKKLIVKKIPAYLAKDFENETQIMAQCSQCPQIVKLLGVSTGEDQYAMILEFMEKGALFDVLQDHAVDLPWNPLRFQIAVDIGKGLSFLHDREILHRDLKSHNILLDGKFNAKITDFGLSKLKLFSSSHSKESQTVPKKSVGTLRWQGPELFKLTPTHTKASDVYAYGMILWEIASRRIPFGTAEEAVIVSSVKDGERETIPEDCPKEYGTLIQSTWVKEPDKRPSAQYIILELQKLKPKPKAKSWHIDPETKVEGEAMGKKYALIPATSKDVEKVVKFYSHHPVPGYEIGSVKVIYNPQFNRGFEVHLGKLQERDQNPAFAPRWMWDHEENPEWREKVDEIARNISKPYADPEYPQVMLFPLWHGTDPAILDSICRIGYANLATTDAGFFGKGLYSAHEAEYAYRVYSKGALVLNWVAVFSPYPVIDEDMNKLAGKANYKNYDAHFIPVFPKNPDNPHEVRYIPCKPFTPHTYTEMVVFESAACLPRYLVELQPTLNKQLKVASQLPPKPKRPLPKSPTTVVAEKPPVNSEPTNPEEQYKLGLQYYDGNGVKQDYARAAKYFQLAVDQGHTNAQFCLGVCYDNGQGVKQDDAMAVKYYKLAADQGHTNAQCCLGFSYKKGRGVKQDDAMAVRYYKLAAEQGDASAQVNLGVCYSRGQGVKQDDAMAVKYITLAAEQRYAVAQYSLGLCYDNGQGVKQDYAMAVKYFTLAADQGYANAQCYLGVCYHFGQGVKQDYTMAVKYYTLAADQGYAEAQFNLGVCYDNGQGVKQDDAMAVKYYKLAADQGHTNAQCCLGFSYKKGRGVKQDDAMAVKYYKLAADQGDVAAIAALKKLTESKVPAMAFGKAAWEQYIDDVGAEPPLPADIDKILQSPCPFWPGKRVHETHLLTLIPKTVNGKPLTLISLEELVKAPKQGNATQYSYFSDDAKQEHGSTPIQSSYWVLMTRNVIEGSRSKSYEDQCQLVANTAKKSGLLYTLPRAIEATVSILMHFVRTKEYLYTDDKSGKQYTHTRCQEKVRDNKWLVAIGGFALASLRIDSHNWDYVSSGVGASRKL